uniref:Lymphocyte antigen 86 n=1 Tax=Capra hircus TaxID=9925 RepID=A0A8C2SAK1_CAPHI
MSPLDKGGGSTWTALFIGPCYRAGHTQGLRAMKGFAAALLIWTLLSPRRAGGEAWPTHTACRNGNLQVLYQSCDPLQDFGFSVDQCSRQLKPNINVRFGMVLREDIEQLFLDVALFSKGLSILNFSYPICEVDLPKFSFCGRRKGETERRLNGETPLLKMNYPNHQKERRVMQCDRSSNCHFDSNRYNIWLYYLIPCTSSTYTLLYVNIFD